MEKDFKNFIIEKYKQWEYIQTEFLDLIEDLPNDDKTRLEEWMFAYDKVCSLEAWYN